MKFRLVQINPVIGDFSGNLELIRSHFSRISDDSCELVIFPELCLTGYPPRDLLEQEWFITRTLQCMEELEKISCLKPGSAMITGCPLPGIIPGTLENCAVVIQNGQQIFRQAKSLLPCYDVFDESRYFVPAKASSLFNFHGHKIGITICEDAWFNHYRDQNKYQADPVDNLCRQGAEIIINISASPYHAGKISQRFDLFSNHAIRHQVLFIHVNQCGGNDELIFDGRSMVISPSGKLLHMSAAFHPDEFLFDNESEFDELSLQFPDDVSDIHKALVTGIRDYMLKCGFKKALVGLSGGIDSALVCALAVSAVGHDNVTGITMPSVYSSEGSVDDSRKLAGNLGINFHVMPISRVFDETLNSLSCFIDRNVPGIAVENLQARIRGNFLMAYSNQFGHLLLNTGNKSEMAVGYCTLYGDMNGGLSVISDIPKTMVYKLAEFINLQGEIIPVSTMTKPPSAELRPDQKDQDTLPPYSILDAVLKHLIEDGLPPHSISELGFDPATVDFIQKSVFRSEYKRKQAPTGLKITPKSFGSGRRFPVACRMDYGNL